ncbi:FecR domain-containing protein [Candidatus Dojkabacteria bacterium]|uniref:FecR domain-containing protein n=1 Tax=Candidatus Dojkabacteria bacterium TaxID=2099670 RepID=A0A955L6B1_9BACT|nr:FecR domain-containing protein [Candidatus Dojkabacteria bacterium]
MDNKNNLEQLLKDAKVAAKDTTVSDEFSNNLKEHLFKVYLEDSQKSATSTIFDYINNLSLGLKVGLSFFLIALLSIVSFYAVTGGDSNLDPNFLANNSNLDYLSQLTHLEGTINITDADGNTIQAAEDSEIQVGSIVNTNSDSKAEISFANGSTLRLDENTSVAMTTITADSISIDLKSGKVFTRNTDNSDTTLTISNIAITDSLVAYSAEFVETNITLSALENDLNFTLNGTINSLDEFETASVNLDDNSFVVAELSEDIYKSDFLTWNRSLDVVYGYEYDNIPPSISITSPEDGFSTDDTFIAILGMVSDSSNLRKIIINNIEYMAFHNEKGFNPEDGSFNVDVPLSEGDNQIDIYAYDKYWNESTESLVVNRNTPPANNDEYEVVVPTKAPADHYLQVLSAIGGCSINMSWQSTGYNTSYGYKVFYSVNPNPTGPGTTYNSNSASINGLPSEEYYVGVCIKDSINGCASPIKYWEGTVSVSSSCQ